jgi:hypothetical protein
MYASAKQYKMVVSMMGMKVESTLSDLEGLRKVEVTCEGRRRGCHPPA